MAIHKRVLSYICVFLIFYQTETINIDIHLPHLTIATQDLDSTRLQVGDLATPLGILTMFNSVLLMFPQLMFPETGQLVRVNTDFVVGLRVGDSGEGDRGNSVPRGIVESEHRPWGRGGSFFNISEDVKLAVSCILHRKEKIAYP